MEVVAHVIVGAIIGLIVINIAAWIISKVWVIR